MIRNCAAGPWSSLGKATDLSSAQLRTRRRFSEGVAATNALENKSDIGKVQEWLGHANVSTTRLYDRRKSKPESL